MRLPSPAPGKLTETILDLGEGDRLRLGELLAHNNEVELYHTDRPGVLVKLFDLNCGKADEVSYGPYTAYCSELANYEEVLGNEVLRPFVPACYGAQIDYQTKRAFIALEYLEGRDLKSWSLEATEAGGAAAGFEAFRRAVSEVLSIMSLFHRHGFVLIDFKPDNAIRLTGESIKLVDLGAMFTPRHRRDSPTFAYSATPDHAEVLIDASNLQSGLAPTEASDVFSAGVALFEMATGSSRLTIESQTAADILANPRIHLFRDSQIRDLWREFPHLRDVLPLVQTQLQERRILFSEFWHLLKAYVGFKVPNWEGLAVEQQEQIILTTGTTFVLEQLPPRLAWLAGPIAHATALRSLRLKNIAELLRLLANPVSEYVRNDIERENHFFSFLRAQGQAADLDLHLNTWEVRLDRHSGHWAIAAPCAWKQFGEMAEFVFLRQLHQDAEGHHYWQVVDELEADEAEGARVTLGRIGNNHFAWLG